MVRRRASADGTFTRLLFLLTASDFVNSWSLWPTMWLVWHRETVGLLHCYYIMAPFLLVANNSVSMMLVLAADRLLSVVAPVW